MVEGKNDFFEQSFTPVNKSAQTWTFFFFFFTKTVGEAQSE